MSEDSHPAKDEIESVAKPTIEQIPFSLVEKHANKTTRLLANSNLTEPIEGQRRWYNYDFKEPLFISKVIVTHNNYQNYHEFQLKALRIDGKQIEVSSKPTENKITFVINCLCDSISFRPPRTYFSGRSISSVEIFGFQEHEIGKFIRYATSIDQIKKEAIKDIDTRERSFRDTIARAEKAETETAEARKEVSNLKSQADRQRSAIKRLESQRDDLTVQVQSQTSSLDNLKTEAETLRSEVETKTKERNNLNTEISNSKTELSSLKANIDLFPSELDSFVKQGAKSNRAYFWLALIPMVVLGACFVLLTSGAVDLTTLITENSKVNLAALVVSRIPYVVVSLALITASYKIARSFIIEVMRVNEQRLNLTKIGIIAKDVSNAAEHELNLDDNTKYHLRLALKMDMLKDHLKGYISTDFKPSVPQSVTEYLPFSSSISGLFTGKKDHADKPQVGSVSEGSTEKDIPQNSAAPPPS